MKTKTHNNTYSDDLMVRAGERNAIYRFLGGSI